MVEFKERTLIFKPGKQTRRNTLVRQEILLAQKAVRETVRGAACAWPDLVPMHTWTGWSRFRWKQCLNGFSDA